MPDASVAIVLSGTGSTREYIQRLGRILRKGKDPAKRALMYEVVAEDTNEEGVSRRRRGDTAKKSPRQLELVPPRQTYPIPPPAVPRAAEAEEDDNW